MSICQKQKLNYSIFFIEQNGSDPFNRAKLMNVGAIEAVKTQLTIDDPQKEGKIPQRSNYVLQTIILYHLYKNGITNFLLTTLGLMTFVLNDLCTKQHLCFRC